MSIRKPKFKIGDDVTIVKYGSLFWTVTKMDYTYYPLYKTYNGTFWYDTSPSEVGKRGIVIDIINTNNRPKYALEKQGMTAWFEETQLKKTTIWQKNNLLKKLIRILTM